MLEIITLCFLMLLGITMCCGLVILIFLFWSIILDIIRDYKGNNR